MKTFFVYFISVVISPIFIMVIMTLFLPVSLGQNIIGILVQTIAGGFISVWFSTLIFSFFGLQPVPFTVFLIGVVFFINTLLGYDFKNPGPVLYNASFLGSVGCLAGVILGGLYFFY